MLTKPATTQDTKVAGALAQGLSRSHLPALDAMRAFSALLVFFYHYASQEIPGGLGVLVFFVLSGFLITWLLLKEHEKNGTISLRRFYLRRSLRIFPAFWAFWVIVLAASWWLHKRVIWPQTIASFFYVNNYYQALHITPTTGLSDTWSLGVEEQFYLLWPTAFLLLARNPRRLVRVVGAVIVCIWMWRFVLYGAGVWQGYFYEAFDTRFDGLATGCVLAILLRSGSGAAFWEKLGDSPWKPLLTLGLLVVSVVAENHFGTTYRDLIGLLIDPVLVAALITQWIALSPREAMWRWLNHPWLTYLGAISYSIYLYQAIVPGFVARAFSHAPGAVRIGLTLAGVLLAASTSYFIIERPFLRLKDGLDRRVKDKQTPEGLKALRRSEFNRTVY